MQKRTGSVPFETREEGIRARAPRQISPGDRESGLDFLPPLYNGIFCGLKWIRHSYVHVFEVKRQHICYLK